MKSLLLSLCLLLPLTAQAAIDAYEFKDAVTQKRFQELTAELRCPKCQNNNIADSDSAIAADLRFEVYRMLQAGASDQEIVNFMVDRYGEFVLYRPRINEMTWLLWYGPFGLLAVGLGVVLLISRKRRRQPDAEVSAGLSASEQERLNKLLQQDDKP